jgi:hypothetical protein
MDKQSLLETPAIWLPEMSQSDWEKEVERMIIRTYATRDFLEGTISFDEFEEVLDFTGLDPIKCNEDWVNGTTYTPQTYDD